MGEEPYARTLLVHRPHLFCRAYLHPDDPGAGLQGRGSIICLSFVPPGRTSGVAELLPGFQAGPMEGRAGGVPHAPLTASVRVLSPALNAARSDPTNNAA